MKFCCITPCLNAERYLEKTMRSILTQDAWQEQHSLYYRVQDGGSTDMSLAVAHRVAAEFEGHPGLRIDIDSQADGGMYDALAKAFALSPPADVYHYLNAGDLVVPTAASLVARALARDDVEWITGMQVVISEQDAVIRASLPFDHDARLFFAGVYGRRLPHLQQESTFWSHRLQQLVDLEALAAFRLAGDQFLWASFFREAPLHTVRAFLGAFRRHEGQLSARYAGQYAAEAASLWRRLPVTHYPLLAYHLFMYLTADNVRARFARRLLPEVSDPS